jgi:hypothetical protein
LAVYNRAEAQRPAETTKMTFYDTVTLIDILILFLPTALLIVNHPTPHPRQHHIS